MGIGKLPSDITGCWDSEDRCTEMQLQCYKTPDCVLQNKVYKCSGWYTVLFSIQKSDADCSNVNTLPMVSCKVLYEESMHIC